MSKMNGVSCFRVAMGISSAIFLGPLLVGTAHAAPDAYGCDMRITSGLSNIKWPAAPATVCIEPGDYAEQLTIYGVAATRQAPITVRAADSSNWPNLKGGVLIRRSSGIVLRNVSASNRTAGALAAILIDDGSSNVKIDTNRAYSSKFGIVVGSQRGQDGLGGPAGAGNIIQNNGVGSDIDLGGIAVTNSSGANPDESAQTYPFGTVVENNTVSGNGGHGIDVDSARLVRIEKNKVSTNGYENIVWPGGYSGIHLFAPHDDKSCGGHQVKYNYVSDTRSSPMGTDGNGIQIDHYCDGNVVAFNVVWNNAAAGIAIYGSGDNQVFSNTLAFNSNQEDRAAKFPGGAVGEIVLSACVVAAECEDKVAHPGRARRNAVFNNIAHSSKYGSIPINVHSSANSAEGENKVGPNLLSTSGAPNDQNWPFLIVDQTKAFNSAQIDALTGVQGNVVEIPRVADPSAPQNDGLRLVAKPSQNGKDFSNYGDLLDIKGVSPSLGASFFGAYYTK